MKKILLFLQLMIIMGSFLLMVLIGLSDQQKFDMLSHQLMLAMRNVLLALEFWLLLISAYLSDKMQNTLSQYFRGKSLRDVFLFTGIIGVLLFKRKK
ncbi:hypothetical protein AB3K25_00825 [Leuconostoc sp. MS02]|uniref:Uncharacterized protein n=1 Tax=Leuconostoc aquikimchii TaxID=3236804 RepID=A0ABV3S4W5_9LACO